MLRLQLQNTRSLAACSANVSCAARHAARPGRSASVTLLKPRVCQQPLRVTATSKYGPSSCTSRQSVIKANLGAAQPDAAPLAVKWDSATKQLVAASTIPFLFLLAPQLIKNTINILSGNLSALAILSWVGFFTALLGNTLLLSYFLEKKEYGASVIQAIGATSNAVMLSQIYLAGYLPAPVFAAIIGIILTAAAVNVSKAAGLLEHGRGSSAWQIWQDILGLVGVATLPQALWLTFLKTETVLPGVLAGAAGVVFLTLEKTRRLPAGLEGLWPRVPAWAATLLFMFQPVAQLVQNFADPGSLAGLALGTVLLGVVSNSLTVPRALLTNDTIWFTGAAWSPVMCWGQLLSMYLGRSAGGERFLGAPAFAGISIALLLYLATIGTVDARVKGLSSPLGSLLGVYGSGPGRSATSNKSSSD